LQHRYYNPDFGRFISQDNPYYIEGTAPVNVNLYAYCLNNRVPRKGTEIQPWQEWQH